MGDFNDNPLEWTESSTLADNTEEPNETTNNTISECDLIQALGDDIFMIFLLLSIAVTFGLSFVVSRKKCFLNCFWGRPGLLQPVNFVDEVYRRWAYAACFVILTSDMLSLLLGESKLNLLPTNDKEWMEKFGWVRVFVKLLEALAVSLVYYPLLACINHRHFVAVNVVGLLYLIPWIVFYSVIFYYCPIRKQGSFFDSLDYIFTIPIYIAFYVVGISYVLDLVKNIRRKAGTKTPLNRRSPNGRKGNLGYEISHHFEYVASLMRPREPEQVIETGNVFKRKLKQLIKRIKYDKIMGFRYSTRLVSCTTIAATLVIWIVITISALIDKELFQELNKLCNPREIVQIFSFLALICEYMFVAEILFHVSSALAGLLVLLLMLNTLVTYKRMWHRLLRGDHSWHVYGTKIESPSSTLLNGLKYAGFQVAYAAWGWIVLTIVLWLVLMVGTFAFFIPLKKGEMTWLIKLLKNMWPTVLLGIIIAVVQKQICRFFFLQDKGSSLALNNRRLYNAASYYFLVLNVIIGFFSCLKRILIPLFLGIFFLSRLDQPLIMKGFETMDPGYVSFVSMLLVDLYHNHPVVKAFVEVMLQVRQQEQSLTEVNGVTVIQSEEKRRRSKLIRNRWWKTVTLANNPSLVLKVLEQRLKDERRNADEVHQNFANSIDGFDSTEMQRIPGKYDKELSVD